MPQSDFIHLHLHTQYSLLDGAIKLDQLFEKAREFRMPAVAVTDHGNMFGAVEFYQKAQKELGATFRPLDNTLRDVVAWYGRSGGTTR